MEDETEGKRRDDVLVNGCVITEHGIVIFFKPGSTDNRKYLEN